MAGGHQMYKPDPAIDQWVLMRENLYKGFRFTPVKTRQVVGLVMALPLIGLSVSAATNGQWDWAGKKKGESLSVNAASKSE